MPLDEVGDTDPATNGGADREGEGREQTQPETSSSVKITGKLILSHAT